MKTYLINFGEGKDCVCAENLFEAVKFHKKQTGRRHEEYLEVKELDADDFYDYFTIDQVREQT